MGSVKRIISASRRTDIPRYFGAWFGRRREAGFARFRNAFGGPGEVSLRDELGYLFWTRYAHPFAAQLAALRGDGIPYVFQYTITGYGRDIERKAPGLPLVLQDFLDVSQTLPDPSCIQWRYDPIVVSEKRDLDFHRTNFRKLAESLRGATRVVNTSIIEPYVRTIRRVADPTVLYRRVDPERHRSVARRYPDLPCVGAEIASLMADLASIAEANGMELRSCSNPELALPPSQCCGPDLFFPYGDPVVQQTSDLRQAPTRPSCRCMPTVDIGMDNTCPAGCSYCYAVTSHETAVANLAKHDPEDAMLRLGNTHGESL
jgi:hypothetical protein